MRITKENILSGIIGFTSAIIGGLLVLGLRQQLGDISAGDVLQFFGALMGTGFAIAGALWMEERKRVIANADAAQPILEALLNLEKRSRTFFADAGRRRQHAESIDRQMILLDSMLTLFPPRKPKLLSLIYRLRLAAAFLTSEHYLDLDAHAPLRPCTERTDVESRLEMLDGPLKLLIVEYSRAINPKAPRSASHLGDMPNLDD